MNKEPKFFYVRGAVDPSELQTAGFNVDPKFDTVLVFDCETCSDFTQKLRVGGFLVKHLPTNTILDAGFFVAEDLPASDFRVTLDYANAFVSRLEDLVNEGAAESPYRKAFSPLVEWTGREGKMPLMTRETFAEYMLDHLKLGHAVIGHNLQFDIARCATSFAGHENVSQGTGFSYCMCDCPLSNSKTETVERVLFAKTARVEQSRFECDEHPSIVTRKLSGRKVQYGLSGGIKSGPLIDTVIVGQALLGQVSGSLENLGKSFRCRILKRKGETKHGGPLTPDYLTYMIQDISATLELFEKEKETFDGHKLSAPLASLYSNASLGKGYLKEFGIPSNIRGRKFYREETYKPLRSSIYMDRAIEGYRGGRSEVMLRLTPKPVAYCDFRSQYPTINAVMKLQELLICRSYSVYEGASAVAKAKELLSKIDAEWLSDPNNWPMLRMFVQIDPTGCILPNKWDGEVAADGSWDDGKVFGIMEFLPGDNGKPWVSLLDVVSSKLFTEGHIPEIFDAFEIVPRKDDSFRIPTFNLFGRSELKIDLHKDDLFVKLIEQRKVLQKRAKAIEGDAAQLDEYYSLDTTQYGLKILANATSYGIYVEVRTEDGKEVSGSYYAPFLASFITSGARLLLCLAQTRARDLGKSIAGQPIYHAMTDTDSMAYIQPDDLDTETFNKVITAIQDYFQRLSPYSDGEPQFDREDKKGADGKLWFYGVSAKRYALFTIESGGRIKLRKVSSHGTGPYMFDRGLKCDGIATEDTEESEYDRQGLDFEEEIEDPQDELEPVDGPGIRENWKAFQAFMWTRAIERALGRRTKLDTFEARYHAGFPSERWNGNVTRMPISITTPYQVHQYSKLGVMPGSFFLVLPLVDGTDTKVAVHHCATQKEMERKTFYNVATGEPIPSEDVLKNLTRMRQSLETYFVNPERKALGVGHGIEQAPGYLSPHKVSFDGMMRRTRKSKTIEDDDE